MGDAGELAEVLDEKMWLGDEENSGENPEDSKDAGVADQAGQEEGDPSTRKLVAGGEETDDDQQYDDESKETGADKKVGASHNPALQPTRVVLG